MPPNTSCFSQQLSSVPAFAPKISKPASRISSSAQLWLVQGLQRKRPSCRVCCVSTRPRRKSGPMAAKSLDAEELVRVLLRNFNDKKPLVSVLNKYVKFITMDHCFLLFEELGRSDKWLQCLEVFRWMQKQRWYIADNGVYSKLISVMGKKGQIRMAMWLFSEMRNSGCRPDTSVYNALIIAHLHSRDKSKAMAKALGYFDKMKGMERCRPNIVTYNILLRAFAQARNVDQVNAMFKHLDESIVTPDIFTFNGVMDAYGKNGMIREMESVLSRMKSNQCKPDIITFNLLIDAYGRKQEFEKMEQVFKSLLRSKEEPTLPTFNSMIINYGKARLRERAELVFQKMTDMGYAPSFITYECLIMMYGYCDCVSRAREIFDGMMVSGKEMKVSSLNAMLDVYCMNGLPMEADRLFDISCNSGVSPHSSTYKLLYKAYTKANMKGQLQKLLARMDKDGIIPNKRFFLDALGVFGSLPASLESSSDRNVLQVQVLLQTSIVVSSGLISSSYFATSSSFAIWRPPICGDWFMVTCDGDLVFHCWLGCCLSIVFLYLVLATVQSKLVSVVPLSLCFGADLNSGDLIVPCILTIPSQLGGRSLIIARMSRSASCSIVILERVGVILQALL